ncbi:MAG: thiamine-phosphate kinase [Chloroflexi bacterium]|nr:thiamine-phosphate kinase [Chloroflexota bacterium]
MPTVKVGELGEFRLIERLARLVASAESGLAAPAPSSPRLLVGIGDDAAAWQMDATVELFTTDTLVQGVHFTVETATWRELGWKAMAVNQSDVAAMGGLPAYALITLGLPLDVLVEEVDELYRGMLEACREYGGAIIGGDIVRSPVAFITVGLTGVTDAPLLLRSAARAGDRVAVTGPVGGSAGGLKMLAEGRLLDQEIARPLREAHLRPRPRIAQGRILAQRGVRCAMDISDGLVDDLSKLCLASRVGARLLAPQVPVHPALRRAFPQEALELALGGGEDYELVFTAPPALMDEALRLLPPGATVIGEILPGPPGQVSVLDREGYPVPVRHGGWDHLRT